MTTKINNLVLTTEISNVLSDLQDGCAEAYCKSIDRATGLILDLIVENEVTDKEVISVIRELRLVTAMIKDLVPKKEKGDEQ